VRSGEQVEDEVVGGNTAGHDPVEGPAAGSDGSSGSGNACCAGSETGAADGAGDGVGVGDGDGDAAGIAEAASRLRLTRLAGSGAYPGGMFDWPLWTAYRRNAATVAPTAGVTVFVGASM
jgi:hypothetical protein